MRVLETIKFSARTSQGFCAAAFVLLAVLFAPNVGQASALSFERYAIPDDSSGVQTQSAKAPSFSGNPTPAIVGGSDTSFEKYPWQVQITRNGQPHCGGTLIHPRIVITAAHCLIDENGSFYTGIQAFTSRTQTGVGGEELSLQNGFVANGYTPGANDFDIGLITLASPSARPQMKIAGADEAAVWKAGRVGVSTGYGAVTEGGSVSPILKEVSMPIQSDDYCAGPNVYFAAFHPQVMLCAGAPAGGQSTCQGDSGGPLLAPIDGGGFRLVGIVSFAKGCARAGFPTVFTRIAEPALSKGISDFATAQSFPGADSAVPVVGSGAKPLGCAATVAAAGTAASAVTAANTKVAGAKKTLAAAKKAVKKAKTKTKKAKKKAAKKAARKAAKKAAKKLASANKLVKSANSALATANTNSAAATAVSQAACN